jgi:hypothetical protein
MTCMEAVRCSDDIFANDAIDDHFRVETVPR